MNSKGRQKAYTLVLIGSLSLLLILLTGRLSSAVDSCVAPPSGLVSWWPGDNSALDIVGTNNGTLMNGATFAAGKVGQAFSFDGVNDYVTVPYTTDLNLQGSITIDA